MYTHSGLDFDFNLFHGGLDDDQWVHHDQIGKSSLLDLGGGVSFAVTPSLQFFVTVAHSIGGRNGHLHAAVSTIGMSRTFGAKSTLRDAALASSSDGLSASKSFVCTCAKSR
jgi:hypothetical protein